MNVLRIAAAAALFGLVCAVGYGLHGANAGAPPFKGKKEIEKKVIDPPGPGKKVIGKKVIDPPGPGKKVTEKKVIDPPGPGKKVTEKKVIDPPGPGKKVIDKKVIDPPGPGGKKVIVKPGPGPIGKKVVIKPGPGGKVIVVKPGPGKVIIKPGVIVLGPGGVRVRVIRTGVHLVARPVVVVPSTGVPDAPVQQTMRYLQVKNDTDEKMTVFVQYRTTDPNGQWAWFPSAPDGGEVLSFEVEPGQESYLQHDDWTVLASRARVWGVTETGAQLATYRDQDLWLVDEVDGQRAYSAPMPDTYTMTFSK